MTVCSDIADYEWLTGDEACALLDDLANDATPLHTAVARLRSRLSPERTHLLIEQVELRRRAAVKFTQAARMFFTRVGLEQATDEWVAKYKAERFAGFAVADLCCGIGGDLVALAGQGAAVGVDRNPIAAHFAAANAGTVVHNSDAVGFDFTDIAAWHIDPDRRPTGRRTTSLQFCQPDLAAIERLLAQAPHAAVKLAPATKVPKAWAERCELEWISRARECRQLVVWHGSLARSPGQHRATVLPAACGLAPGAACGLAPRSIVGQPNQRIPITDRVDRYVFDIDAAVLAAGLKGTLAAEHELAALSAGPTYLTGPGPIDDAALSTFDVADVLALETRKLASGLRERGIGELEIKKRGVEFDPEKLRRNLKLRGDHRATLLITPLDGRPVAILARRISRAPTPIHNPLLKSEPFDST